MMKKIFSALLFTLLACAVYAAPVKIEKDQFYASRTEIEGNVDVQYGDKKILTISFGFYFEGEEGYFVGPVTDPLDQRVERYKKINKTKTDPLFVNGFKVIYVAPEVTDLEFFNTTTESVFNIELNGGAKISVHSSNLQANLEPVK